MSSEFSEALANSACSISVHLQVHKLASQLACNLLHSLSTTVFVGQWMVDGSLPPCNLKGKIEEEEEEEEKGTMQMSPLCYQRVTHTQRPIWGNCEHDNRSHHHSAFTAPMQVAHMPISTIMHLRMACREALKNAGPAAVSACM